jgi:23S rRNA (guanosine2251-2'-O)-methyltransferase
VLARKAGPRAVHQGVAALVSAVPYADLESICRAAAAREDGILVILDRIEDPHNLGAVLRAAAAAGADGVLIGAVGAVGLTPAVAKVSAGALDRIPVSREPRLRRRLSALKGSGFRVVALDPRGETPWDRADLTGRIAVLAGGEGAGLRRALAQEADLRVSIPLGRGVESLNVSVSVAVLLFEAVRQRRAKAAASR